MRANQKIEFSEDVLKCLNGSKKEDIGLFFLDSGAHGLFNRHSKKDASKDRYEFFETDEFWQYVDEYAAFVKKNLDVIDIYVNVDVIFNPRLSYTVLKYLESKHSLHPMPVLHYGTPMEWVEKHLEDGYDLIGLGGLGQGSNAQEYAVWADKVYSRISPGPTHCPTIRTHGFAMTSYELMIKFPWWSVDSSSWTKMGAFGGIYVPRKKGGKYDFSVNPYAIHCSSEARGFQEEVDIPETHELGVKKNKLGTHVSKLSKEAQKVIKDWLEYVGVPYGNYRTNAWGVSTHHSARKIANLRFFQKLVEWLPQWPWPYRPKGRREGFFS